MSKPARHALLAGVLSLSIAGTCLGAGAAEAAGGVILWNTLDSAYEVTHSRIGPNGSVVGGSFAFEPGQFGKGYVRKSAGGNYIRFTADIFNQVRERGTAALWVNPKVPYPQPYNYGLFGLINGAYISNGSINLEWGDTVSGGSDLSGSITFGSGPGVNALSYGLPRFVATPGVPFHVAIVWDIDGIDGGTDTVRIYRDGKLITTSTAKWNPAGAPRPDFILGSSPDGNGYDKYIVDNVVLYDYAKTDFSDRFSENPASSADLADVRLHLNLGQNPLPSEEVATTSGGAIDGANVFFAAKLILSEDANGLNPPSEAVSVSVGDWRLSLPAGSLIKKGPCFEYEGNTDQGRVFMKVQEKATNTFAVIVKVSGADLPSIVDPVRVTVRIGDDGTSTMLDLRGPLHGVAVPAVE